MELEKVSAEYLDYLKKIKRYSKNTLISYCTDLKDFLNYCNESGKINLDSVTNKFVLQYMIKLNDAGLDMKSISRKLSAIRGMFRYAFVNGLIENNPMDQIINPKIKRKLPEIASENTVLQIITNPEEPLLVKVIFEILYGCALRVSELCSLNRGDLDISRRLLKVKGKGNKERIVPVGSKSIEVLKEYLTINNYSNTSPLIQKGGRRIYPQYVYRVVKKYLSRVTDIEKKSPHILRHSAATHMLDRGADLNAVKEILGHESLSTTQVYTHVSVERLKKAYKKAHPKS